VKGFPKEPLSRMSSEPPAKSTTNVQTPSQTRQEREETRDLPEEGDALPEFEKEGSKKWLTTIKRDLKSNA